MQKLFHKKKYAKPMLEIIDFDPCQMLCLSEYTMDFSGESTSEADVQEMEAKRNFFLDVFIVSDTQW